MHISEIIELRIPVALPSPGVRRLLREALHLTQEDVASLIGVDRATVSRWESGTRTPTGPVAERYADLLTQLQERVKWSA